MGEGLNFLFRYSIFFSGNIFNALYLDVTCDPVVARISVLENPGIHHSTQLGRSEDTGVFVVHAALCILQFKLRSKWYYLRSQNDVLDLRSRLSTLFIFPFFALRG